jgi:DNA-binding CsgD family transcriptional regulator/PAS domain-containing protein
VREVEREGIVDGLICAAYDAAAGNGDWEEFVRVSGAIFPWSKTAFCLFDRSSEHCTAFSTVNFDPQYLKTWEEHYSYINPWIRMTEGSDWDFRWSDEKVPEAELKNTEFYAGWVRPQEDISLGFAVNVSNETDRTFLITNTFRQKDRTAAAGQISILRRVRPHLLRAFRFQGTVGRIRAYAEGLEAALDAVGHAIFVVDRDCRIGHANRAAEEMMAAGLLFGCDSSRQIVMKDAVNDTAIKRLVRIMQRPRDVLDPPFVVLRSPGPQRFFALVMPVYARQGRSMPQVVSVPSPSATILLIIDLLHLGRDPATAFRQLFGLTPSETRIALAFCRGQSMRDYADRNGITYETARKQLQAVQEKAGVGRQAELMRLLTRIATIG